jgi:hypothetical protein
MQITISTGQHALILLSVALHQIEVLQELPTYSYKCFVLVCCPNMMFRIFFLCEMLLFLCIEVATIIFRLLDDIFR